MKTTVITLIRHGATPWSTTGRFAGRTDIPLTDNGRAAARATRTRLDGTHFTHALTSPLARATETAELLEANATPDDRLRERDYGDYEGLTTAQIREHHPGWNVWTDTIPGGEPLTTLSARVDAVVHELHAHDDGNILLIAHAHWIRLFTARWLRLPPTGAALFRLDTLGITRLGWERENPVMLTWNTR